MSFNIPRNVPDFKADQRGYEDALWNSSGRSRFAGSNGAAGFSFRGAQKELPMYKDKPYSYPLSRRKSSKRFVAVLALLSVIACWYVWSRPSSKATWKPAASSNTRNTRGSIKGKGQKFWTQRRGDVVAAMEKTWAAYEKHAWGLDEFYPDSKSGRQMVPPTGLGWIIVDALDTMMLMNMTTQLKHARDWISATLTYDLDHDVNTFETTIRMLGGLLSAHYLQTSFPDLCPVDFGRGGEDLYLEKATDLAERVMGAFESPSGVPYASVNLKQRKGLGSHSDGGASSLAEATTVQLEFKYIANLTGEKDYWDRAEKVMEVVDGIGIGMDGLKSIFISPQTGTLTSSNFRLGSRGDSYYEYLIKQYLQTKETIYLDMWNEALDGIKKHLVTYTTNSNFTIIAERPYGLLAKLEPKMDHLVCFMPGTLALSTTGGLSVEEATKRGLWSTQKQADLDLAIELTKTCWGMYKATKTGLAGEITYFDIGDHPVMYNDATHRPAKPAIDIFEREPEEDAAWRKDFIVKPNDAHNLQRPETVESLFYMWRITGDERYRQWGSDMFESFMQHTQATDGNGYTSISDVNALPPPSRNNMESFWPAETLKYFYLLFSPNDLLPLDQVVFNTEAHPLPRFEIGRVLRTGWSRKPKVPGTYAPDDHGGATSHQQQQQQHAAEHVAVASGSGSGSGSSVGGSSGVAGAQDAALGSERERQKVMQGRGTVQMQPRGAV